MKYLCLLNVIKPLFLSLPLSLPLSFLQLTLWQCILLCRLVVIENSVGWTNQMPALTADCQVQRAISNILQSKTIYSLLQGRCLSIIKTLPPQTQGSYLSVRETLMNFSPHKQFCSLPWTDRGVDEAFPVTETLGNLRVHYINSLFTQRMYQRFSGNIWLF